ncbi:MAG: hypothetical protein KJO29_07830, partial [Bacteroidia bacterium]|nr:hypothetical protein [Bacteroidia bacterium]
MYRKLLAGLLICFYSLNTYGQTNGLNPEVSPLHDKEVFVLPAMDHQKLVDRYDKNPKSGPVRFAEP